MLQHFVTVELSSNSIDQIVFPVTMNLVGQNVNLPCRIIVILRVHGEQV